MKQNAIEHPFQVREKENIDAKRAVAQKALELIPDNSSLILGTGSTTLELAKLLSFKSGLKIFTDSMPVALQLFESSNQVFMFGGELRAASSQVRGGWTVRQIRELMVDICFIGTDGFSNLSGPTTPSSSDAFIDQEIFASSEKRYVLADLSKFRRKSLYKICDWSDITGLVTNREADAELVRALSEKTDVILG